MPDGDKHDPQQLVAAAPPEAPLVCPECGATVAPAAYEGHLRQAHRLHAFRGQHRSYTETLALLLNLLAETPPDAEAWRILQTLMREEHGARAPTVLAALLGGAADPRGRRPPESRRGCGWRICWPTAPMRA